MPRRGPSDNAYIDRVDALARAAVADGSASFAALLRCLPAVYPTEALASLDRLAASGAIDERVALRAWSEAGRPAAPAGEGRSLLPLPHPLDYEWRFTPDAARALLDRAATIVAPGGDLLLFGTPGLAVEALAMPVGHRLAFLAEDNSVTRRVIALNRATGSPLAIAFCSGGLPRETADAVILDPPWYLDFVRPMLAAAAHACRIGGAVLISLPPIGTRPSAEADLQAALRFGRRLGLDPVEHQELAIGYETPFFERNALAAAGIYPPPRWRRGDLVIFRKVRATSRPPSASETHRRPWTEVGIGRMRVFIRKGEAAAVDAKLDALVDGGVLPTVSRRDPRRALAQVWTSGNRIYRTANPQLVLDAAISCAGEVFGSGAQRGLWGSVHEHQALERVADELRGLAAIEAREEQGVTPTPAEGSRFWTSPSTNFWSMSTATISG